jgi:hypothetical protein
LGPLTAKPVCSAAIAEARRGDAGRHSVRLGENDVKPNGDHPKLGELRDQVRNDRARPRPLSNLLEARFIDVDDDDRPRHRLAWPQRLIEVEGPQPNLLERLRIQDAQRHERKQQ